MGRNRRFRGNQGERAEDGHVSTRWTAGTQEPPRILGHKPVAASTAVLKLGDSDESANREAVDRGLRFTVSLRTVRFFLATVNGPRDLRRNTAVFFETAAVAKSFTDDPSWRVHAKQKRSVMSAFKMGHD